MPKLMPVVHVKISTYLLVLIIRTTAWTSSFALEYTIVQYNKHLFTCCCCYII
jgi:hypothetical protein